MFTAKQRPVRGTRLFAKLVLVIVPCFLIASAVGLHTLAEIELQKKRDALTTRIGNAAGRVAGAIERSSFHQGESGIDVEPVQLDLMSTLLADQAVRCAELHWDETEGVRLSVPLGLGCNGQAFDQTLDIPLYIDGDHTLLVHFSTDELDAAHRSRREFSFLVLCAGLLITVFSSWLGFALMVGRPLNQLLSAIRQSQETGKPTQIDAERKDELGVVFEAFNHMQGDLSRETSALRRAHAQLDHVYNTTPAMLCSCDTNGILTSVSDHWVAMIGTSRDTIIGQSIESFMDSDSKSTFRDHALLPVAAGKCVHDVPVKLRSHDRRQIDVLLSAVPDIGVDGSVTCLCVMSDVSLLKEAERRLHQLAGTDALTSLPNRRGLVEHLGRIIDRETGGSTNLVTAVLFIDLDNFKWINDTYGHESGDALLIEVGERLRQSVRVNDFIARLGGDEFAIICYRLDNRRKVEEIAERIINKLKLPFEQGDMRSFVNASIGIAYVDPGLEGPNSLLQLADQAMYHAKQSGKGCYRTFNRELGSKAADKAKLREQIQQGLESETFFLLFQPIVDLETETPIGAEALLRLTGSDGDIVPPDAFIPVAEETGQIRELGAWVIDTGFHKLDLLQGDESHDRFYVALNLSTRQLDDQLIDRVQGLFQRYPEARGRIVLEITETALLQHGEHAADLLRTLQAIGVRIALDDFGTGYSSLSHVHEFPVDILKIDKSFVAGLGTRDAEATRRQMAMIRTTSSLAQALGIALIAEGIESATASRILQDCGVRFGQGYFFSRPMPPEVFVDWHQSKAGKALPSQKNDGPAPNALAM